MEINTTYSTKSLYVPLKKVNKIQKVVGVFMATIRDSFVQIFCSSQINAHQWQPQIRPISTNVTPFNNTLHTCSNPSTLSTMIMEHYSQKHYIETIRLIKCHQNLSGNLKSNKINSEITNNRIKNTTINKQHNNKQLSYRIIYNDCLLQLGFYDEVKSNLQGILRQLASKRQQQQQQSSSSSLSSLSLEKDNYQSNILVMMIQLGIKTGDISTMERGVQGILNISDKGQKIEQYIVLLIMNAKNKIIIQNKDDNQQYQKYVNYLQNHVIKMMPISNNINNINNHGNIDNKNNPKIESKSNSALISALVFIEVAQILLHIQQCNKAQRILLTAELFSQKISTTNNCNKHNNHNKQQQIFHNKRTNKYLHLNKNNNISPITHKQKLSLKINKLQWKIQIQKSTNSSQRKIKLLQKIIINQQQVYRARHCINNSVNQQYNQQNLLLNNQRELLQNLEEIMGMLSKIGKNKEANKYRMKYQNIKGEIMGEFETGDTMKISNGGNQNVLRVIDPNTRNKINNY